jgi:hypothetical protein
VEVRIVVHLDGLVRDFREASNQEPLPKFELAGFTVTPRSADGNSYFSRSRAEHVATLRLDLGETTLVNPPTVYQKVENLISIFRLFKKGYLAGFPVVLDTWAEEIGEFVPGIEFGRSALGPQGGMVYGLAESEISPLQKFGKRVLPLMESSHYRSTLSPALHFFNRGLDDFESADMPMAIVDFVGCVEALLGTSQTELVHRLSHTIAVVSERRPDKRKERYDLFKKIYGSRSKVIHGMALEDNERGQVVYAEDAARTVVGVSLEYYQRGFTKKGLLDDVQNVSLGTATDLAVFSERRA